MTEFAILPDEPEEERPAFEHRPSRIVFEVVEGDSRELPGREVEDWACDGGDAEIEAEAVGPLEDDLFPMLSPEQIQSLTPGWHIVVGFSMDYSKDYWGEVSGDCSFDEIRPATADEVQEVKSYGQTNRLPGSAADADPALGLEREPGPDDEGLQQRDLRSELLDPQPGGALRGGPDGPGVALDPGPSDTAVPGGVGEPGPADGR
jgi:hypothetical protein